MAITCPKCHSENPETKQFCADCGTQLLPPVEIDASKTSREVYEALAPPLISPSALGLRPFGGEWAVWETPVGQ
jgi:hypothetical protein